MGAIFTYAVIGTLLNVFAVGFAMYGLFKLEAMGTFESRYLDHEYGQLSKLFQLLTFRYIG